MFMFFNWDLYIDAIILFEAKIIQNRYLYDKNNNVFCFINTFRFFAKFSKAW